VCVAIAVDGVDIVVVRARVRSGGVVRKGLPESKVRRIQRQKGGSTDSARWRES
jgi:hypothetical protein